MVRSQTSALVKNYGSGCAKRDGPAVINNSRGSTKSLGWGSTIMLRHGLTKDGVDASATREISRCSVASIRSRCSTVE